MERIGTDALHKLLRFPVSQSSRRRSGANKLKSVFCGGVYVAKNTLRGESVFCPPAAGKTRGSERNSLTCKGLRPLQVNYSIVPPPSTSSPS